jgi:mono/diheme cytochrome c family protein
MIKLSAVVLGGAAVAVLWASIGTLIQQAPAKAPSMGNPFRGSATAEPAGEKLYPRECAACHGDRRQGNHNAPPLDRADIRGAAPGALFWVLRNGALRHGMPSLASLPEPQRWQIVTFLQATR